MQKNLKIKAIIILGAVWLCVWLAHPLDEKINLGLDLQGGMHLVLRVDTSELPPEAKQDATERALEIIRNRIDEFGVKEPLIQRQGQYNIVVQLPGVTDRKRALDLIGRTALLELKLVSDDPEKLKQAIEGAVPSGFELKAADKETLLVEKEASLTGEYLVDARVDYDQSMFGQPYVAFTLESKGAKQFAKLTRDSIGRRLAIVLDDKIHSAPVIQTEIPNGQGRITGNFGQQEATDLAIVLRAGALPAPIYVEEERTVGPLLGQDSIRSGIRATIIGVGLVVVFMLLYYLLAGVIANIAIALNLLIILAALAYFKATLTLPGIAGIILTMGMAVDANVLIYERIREELKIGRPIRTAIANGYKKAFSAIIDSNITTLIAAVLLFHFGTGPIRGFAITLTIGIAASLFTALFVTRTVFDFFCTFKGFKVVRMLEAMKPRNFDFIGKRGFCFVLSAVLIIGGFGYFMYKGKDAYGIDFTGGQLQQYSFAKPVPITSVRQTLRDAGLDSANIQQFGKGSEVIIKTAEDTTEAVQSSFREKYPDNKFDLMRVEKVGPAVGKELQDKAIKALLFALVGILIYVGFRFHHFNYAAAGIIAIFHDCLITMGFLAFTGREMSLTLVAAILTIAGYSINDTIVIYDRVRELSRTMHKASIREIINAAINQTLSRTVLTTFTTLLVVTAIFFFGGEVLNGFAFALMVGFISGIYSTIYIASPLIIAWHRRGKS